jgi:hypothetical protein
MPPDYKRPQGRPPRNSRYFHRKRAIHGQGILVFLEQPS